MKEVSLVIDSNDGVHISFVNHSNSDLYYATNTLGYWSTTPVDIDHYVGPHSSMESIRTIMYTFLIGMMEIKPLSMQPRAE